MIRKLPAISGTRYVNYTLQRIFKYQKLQQLPIVRRNSKIARNV